MRFSTDDGRAPDDRVWPDGDVPNNLAVRLQSTSGSDFGRAVNDNVGADDDTGVNGGGGIDEGAGMDHGRQMMPLSRKLK